MRLVHFNPISTTAIRKLSKQSRMCFAIGWIEAYPVSVSTQCPFCSRTKISLMSRWIETALRDAPCGAAWTIAIRRISKAYMI